MRILIDNREATLFRILKKICEPEVVKLRLGDLVIANDGTALVVERKTVSDFVGSVRSNRLWSTILTLSQTNFTGDKR